MATQAQTHPTVAQDFLPLKGTDHIEFYVGNARQAAHFYRTAFGMSLVAYAGPETGHRDRASYVLQQGKVRFVLTTALQPKSKIAEHVHHHGDGVRSIALWVDDARSAWLETTSRGAVSVQEPAEISDPEGRVVTASIAAYGDTLHTFVERKDYSGVFFPGYQTIAHDPIAQPVGLLLDRVLRADVEGDGERQWAGEIPHQRAGGRPTEVADRGVSGLLSGSGRAAHRAGNPGHRIHRDKDETAGRRLPDRAA
jgi:4-hydroxyphenylpyruvate dioxygenase